MFVNLLRGLKNDKNKKCAQIKKKKLYISKLLPKHQPNERKSEKKRTKLFGTEFSIGFYPLDTDMHPHPDSNYFFWLYLVRYVRSVSLFSFFPILAAPFNRRLKIYLFFPLFHRRI